MLLSAACGKWISWDRRTNGSWPGPRVSASTFGHKFLKRMRWDRCCPLPSFVSHRGFTGHEHVYTILAVPNRCSTFLRRQDVIAVSARRPGPEVLLRGAQRHLPSVPHPRFSRRRERPGSRLSQRQRDERHPRRRNADLLLPDRARSATGSPGHCAALHTANARAVRNSLRRLSAADGLDHRLLPPARPAADRRLRAEFFERIPRPAAGIVRRLLRALPVQDVAGAERRGSDAEPAVATGTGSPEDCAAIHSFSAGTFLGVD